jgi:hypothetical protein
MLVRPVQLMLGIVATVAFGWMVAISVSPASAMASPTITESGIPVKSGKGFILIGEGTMILTLGSLNVSCNDYWLTGTVAENAGSGIKLTIEKASFHNESFGVTSECSNGAVSIPALTSGGGASHWCMTMNQEVEKDPFEMQWAGCGSSGGTFTMKIGECAYTRTEPLTGIFTTNGTPATLVLSGEPEFSQENVFCPKLRVVIWNYRLYTDTEAISKATEDPLTIS